MKSSTMTIMMILHAFLIVTLVDIYDCGTENECGRNCFVDKWNTLICKDIIPSCIPEGITRVNVDSTFSYLEIITASNFTGRNWDQVTYLRLSAYSIIGGPSVNWTLSASCFVAWESVRELHISIDRLLIDPNSLVGLSKLEVIDFTGCHSLNIEELLLVLNGTNKMANLKKIVLSDWDTWQHPYNLDDKLIDVLLPRNITEIDVSRSHLSALNATTLLKRMDHLKSLNVSHTTMASVFLESNWNLCDDPVQLETLDMAYFRLPNEIPILPTRYYIVNVSYHEPNPDPKGFLQIFWSVLNINATGIVQLPTSFWIENSRFILGKKLHFRTKHLEFKENNINRLDCKVANVTFDLEYLGLSYNNLEFLHSSILSMMPNLTRLDLSRNLMYIMHEEDPHQFGQLLSGVPALRYINLSNNNLTHIPLDFFKHSLNLSTIDLSYNRLTQFTFTVSGLTNLRIIDMCSNIIKILDATSIYNLQIYQSSENSNVRTCDLILTSNPISCSQCTAKPFLEWILSTRLVDVKSQGLKCIDEKGNRIAIDENVISAAHYICIRRTIIISVTLSATVVLISAIAVFVWLNKRRKWANILTHRCIVINRIREGEGAYEFPVFFSYSSEDEVFALDNVRPHLNDNLRIVTGIYYDRNLVCTGDANLRPGFYVHDEIDFCLDKSSIVIILVTENYCMSEYCGSEIEKAYMKKKPVVLMFKEHVSEDLMSRTMRELYKRNVRILWAQQNGEYVLQTTWENICTSIIDLIE